jgi:hypothetical protein
MRIDQRLVEIVGQREIGLDIELGHTTPLQVARTTA